MEFKNIEVYNLMIDSINEDIDKMLLVEQSITGCMDNAATNYDPTATIACPNCCRFAVKYSKTSKGGPKDEEEELIRISKEYEGELHYKIDPTYDPRKIVKKGSTEVAGLIEKIKVNPDYFPKGNWARIYALSRQPKAKGIILKAGPWAGRLVTRPVANMLIKAKRVVGLKAAIRKPARGNNKTPGFCWCYDLLKGYIEDEPFCAASGANSQCKAGVKSEIKKEVEDYHRKGLTGKGERLDKAWDRCNKVTWSYALFDKVEREDTAAACKSFKSHLTNVDSAGDQLGGLLGKYFRIKGKKWEPGVSKGGGDSVASKLAKYQEIEVKFVTRDVIPEKRGTTTHCTASDGCQDFMKNRTYVFKEITAQNDKTSLSLTTSDGKKAIMSFQTAEKDRANEGDILFKDSNGKSLSVSAPWNGRIVRLTR
tara:strand:+ start:160 stop:1431 length:1272 start_codon:yes stop_codon:yes gene_type:complete